jgi:hypothetical protein
MLYFPHLFSPTSGFAAQGKKFPTKAHRPNRYAR